jgi:hypothetical protein
MILNRPTVSMWLPQRPGVRARRRGAGRLRWLRDWFGFDLPSGHDGNPLHNAAGIIAQDCHTTTGVGSPPCWPCVTPIPDNLLITPSGINLASRWTLLYSGGTYCPDLYAQWTSVDVNQPWCLSRVSDCDYAGIFSAGTFLWHYLDGLGGGEIQEFNVRYNMSVTLVAGTGATLAAVALIVIEQQLTRVREYVNYATDGSGNSFALDGGEYGSTNPPSPLAYKFWDTDGATPGIGDGFGSRYSMSGPLGWNEIGAQPGAQGGGRDIFASDPSPVADCGTAITLSNQYTDFAPNTVDGDYDRYGKNGTVTIDPGGC